MSTSNTKLFSWSSTNLWTTIFTSIFGLLALSGMELSAPPGDLAGDLVYSVTTLGWVGSIGLIVTNGLNIGYHIFVRVKDGTFWEFLGSTNFYINLVSLGIGVLVVFIPGAIIPAGTAESIVEMAYAQDWTGLIFLIFVNIITPIIRAAKDRFAVN